MRTDHLPSSSYLTPWYLKSIQSLIGGLPCGSLTLTSTCSTLNDLVCYQCHLYCKIYTRSWMRDTYTTFYYSTVFTGLLAWLLILAWLALVCVWQSFQDLCVCISQGGHVSLRSGSQGHVLESATATHCLMTSKGPLGTHCSDVWHTIAPC